MWLSCLVYVRCVLLTTSDATVGIGTIQPAPRPLHTLGLLLMLYNRPSKPMMLHAISRLATNTPDTP